MSKKQWGRRILLVPISIYRNLDFLRHSDKNINDFEVFLAFFIRVILVRKHSTCFKEHTIFEKYPFKRITILNSYYSKGEKMELKENERIDDLQFKGLKIIQNSKGFCFGIDAVLLSDFATTIKEDSTVIDLCSGTGIISILLEAKTSLKKIYAVEIQKEISEMSKRSVELNGQQMKIEIINKDLREINTIFPKSSIDAIVVNPPYKKMGSGIINELDTKTISRHEIFCTLEDIIDISSQLLKPGSSLFMIHKAERLVDVLFEMRKRKIEPKRIRFIHPTFNKAPNLFLVEGVKNGKSFLKIEEPIYVYDSNEKYTDTILKIYNMKECD